MVIKLRGDFVTNEPLCASGYTVNGSITSVTTNHATNDDFLHKLK